MAVIRYQETGVQSVINQGRQWQW